MNELINHITKEATLSSLEVAKMIEKQHKNLLSDIRGYVEELNELKIEPVNFFQESTYTDKKEKQGHALMSQRKVVNLSLTN